MCGEIESVIVPPPPLPPTLQRPSYIKSMQTLNMKSEADRRKTYKEWHVPFMDKNHLAAAGFYFTNSGDVVRCAFCGVEVGYWKKGDNAIADHQRWSPSCGFINGLFVGNIPIGSETSLPSQQTSRSYDVCGSLMELRPNSRPEQSK
jgi:hypothetical protein